jgi:hypothetical protein
MTVEPKNYGRNLKGELLTEELIEKLVQEAEEGWEVEELLTWKEIDPASEPAPSEGDQASASWRSRRRR